MEKERKYCMKVVKSAKRKSIKNHYLNQIIVAIIIGYLFMAKAYCIDFIKGSQGIEGIIYCIPIVVTLAVVVVFLLSKWSVKNYKYLEVTLDRTICGCYVPDDKSNIIDNYWKAFQTIQRDYAGKKLKTDTHASVIASFLNKSKEEKLVSLEEVDSFIKNNKLEKPSKMEIELANGSVVKIKYKKEKKNVLKIVSYMDSDIQNMNDKEIQKMYKDITGKCKYYKVEIEVPNER